MSIQPRQPSIGQRISQLFRESQLYLAKELKQFDIGTGQYMLLCALYRQDGMSQEELAEWARIDKANVTRGVSRLAELGYVRRVRDDADKRVNHIHLTPKALAIKESFLEVLLSWSKILTRGFSDRERMDLIGELERMERNAVAHRR